MSTVLVVGAGITGGYIATRLQDGGVDVALLARAAKADRLQHDGLRLRDGITGGERTVRLPIEREPVSREYDVVLVCVQEEQRETVEHLVSRLPGRAAVCFLGNTVAGYERAGELLGRDRIAGGFPGVGGLWDGDVLVYADRRNASSASAAFVVIGAAFPEAVESCRRVEKSVARAGMKVKRYEPILPWQLCHAALVLPLAGLFYRHEGSLQAAVADREGIRQTVRAVAQGLRGLSRLGYPVLPRWLRLLYLLPPSLGMRQLSGLLRTPFAEIALAGHARAARDEMKALSAGLLNLLGDAAGHDCRELLRTV